MPVPHDGEAADDKAVPLLDEWSSPATDGGTDVELSYATAALDAHGACATSSAISSHDGAGALGIPHPPPDVVGVNVNEAGGRPMGCWRQASRVWSPVLLVFSLFITYYDIANGTTTAFGYGHCTAGRAVGEGAPVYVRVVNVILFTVLLLWVAALEGAQVALVALADAPPSAISRASAAVQRAIHRALAGQNLERFIIGRQFLLVFVVFIVSKLASHEAACGALNPFGWRWPHEANVIFLQNNVLLMLVIAVPGQLVGQVVAARDAVRFLELLRWPLGLCVAPALALEATGVMHCAYVLKDAFARWSNTAVDPRTVMAKTVAYQCKAAFSVALALFCAVVVSAGVLQGQTHASDGAGWHELPAGAAYVLLLVFLVVIGGCEGLQISAVKLREVPEISDKPRKVAAAGVVLLHAEPTPRLQHFLMGRQLFAAVAYVLLARCTAFSGTDGRVRSGGFWGWNRVAIAVLLQSGLLGAILVTNVGVLAWRMAASCFPVAFMDSWPAYGLLRVVLAVEATGIVGSAWVLGDALDRVTAARYQGGRSRVDAT